MLLQKTVESKIVKKRCTFYSKKSNVKPYWNIQLKKFPWEISQSQGILPMIITFVAATQAEPSWTDMLAFPTSVPIFIAFGINIFDWGVSNDITDFKKPLTERNVRWHGAASMSVNKKIWFILVKNVLVFSIYGK